MTKPRTRRYLRTKRAILDAALKIINQEGVDALNMRDLADRIDYSPAGLYEYFGGKDEIIAAICQEGHEKLAAAMDTVDHTLPVEEHMRGLGQAYIQFALTYPDYFLLMFTNAEPPEITTAGSSGEREESSSFGILVEAIRRGIDAGVYQPRPGYGWLEMAYTAWALVHGIATLRITSLRHFEYDLDDADIQALSRLHHGLTAVPH